MNEDTGVFTNIDAFVRYLQEHGETESSTIAASLGVSERNVEEWAKMLESSKMAKIVYKLGKMFVAPVASIESGSSEAKQMVEVKKTILDSEVTAQLGDIARLEERMKEFNKMALESENVLNSNSSNIREALNRISKLQAEAAKSFEVIKGRKNEIDNFSQEIDTLLSKLSGDSTLGGVMEKSGNAKILVEDIRTRVHAYEEGIANLMRIYDEGVSEERKKLVEFSKGTREEIEALKGLLKEEEKNMANYDDTYRKFKNDSARIRQMVEKNKSELLDKSVKVRSEIDEIYKVAADESAKLDAILAKAKEGLAGFEELNGKLAEIKKDVAEALVENSQIKAEIEMLAQELKEAESMSRSKIREKQVITNNIDKKTKKTAEKLSAHGKRLDNIEGKVDKLV